MRDRGEWREIERAKEGNINCVVIFLFYVFIKKKIYFYSMLCN